MISSKNDGKVFCVLEPWMTTELALAGYDLLVFAYIHSITQGGKKTFYASAEAISKKWFGDESKVRTIKTSLSALIQRGYLECYKGEVSGRIRNIYTSRATDILTQIRNGMAVPSARKKRRNAPNSGTLPPTNNISTRGTVPPNDSGSQTISDSGTVPPNVKDVPYHYDGGTVPPNNSGTQTISDSGTVPRQIYIIKKIYEKYSLSKGVEIDTQEEQQNFKIIFFFRNAQIPEKEVNKFVAYNIRKDWGHGEMLTHDKRIVCAENDWTIDDGARIDNNLLEFLRVMYCWGRKNNIEGVECLLDTHISGRALDKNTYFIKCPEIVKVWLERQKETLRNAMHKCLKTKALYYE